MERREGGAIKEGEGIGRGGEGERMKKEVESDSFHTAEATAFHSDPLSHHCCWHPVLPALLLA